jgi:aspartyl-tRNA(Asn)/glutamyl-tRNA(Gln) amidotransferase subunit C
METPTLKLLADFFSQNSVVHLPASDYICPMEVTDALIEKTAQLARLQFNAEEKEQIKQDLQRMIAFVEKLHELKMDDSEPLLHMTEETNVLREDMVIPSISREEALQNAPQHDGIFFKVPKVIKK